MQIDWRFILSSSAFIIALVAIAVLTQAAGAR